LRDKDAAGMIEALLPIATRFVLPQVRTERALPPQELAALIHTTARAFPVTLPGSFDEAFASAESHERTHPNHRFLALRR
jgi:dihydrofolate synthase/folylpolyglutamate synthase